MIEPAVVAIWCTMLKWILPAIASSMLVSAGCSSKPDGFDGPTVDAFTGRVVRDGQPINLPGTDSAQLKLIHNPTGQSFGIPLQPDGSFTIGWMPIGKYSAMLERKPKDAKGGPQVYNVPGGFEIEAGKTEYSVELGKGLKL